MGSAEQSPSVLGWPTPMRRVIWRGLLFRMLLRAVTPRAQVFVHGWPDSEENALLTAIAFRRTTTLPVVFGCHDRHTANRLLHLHAGAQGDSGIRIIRKNSWMGVIEFLRSTVVLSTHGIFGNPQPGTRRLHVLLGHGHGPKSASSAAVPTQHRAQLAITNNAVWGNAVINDQGIPRERVVVTGNPREDSLLEPATADSLDRLGIGAKPFVVWLPTYRIAWNARETADAKTVVESEELMSRLQQLFTTLEESGVTVVAKTHSLDGAGFGDWAVHWVDDEALLSAGTSLYRLLGASSGLVSDYSSVWVDVLRHRIAVGLLLADAQDFERTRHLNEPHVGSLCAAIRVEDDPSRNAFVAAVKGTGDDWFIEQIRIADALESSMIGGATDRTVEAVLGKARALGIDVAEKS